MILQVDYERPLSQVSTARTLHFERVVLIIIQKLMLGELMIN